MAKPDVVICPSCESELYYVTRENFINCNICETEISVAPTVIIEDENNDQEIQITDLELIGQSVSEREIQEIIQGQQISDLEIRLLAGGL